MAELHPSFSFACRVSAPFLHLVLLLLNQRCVPAYWLPGLVTAPSSLPLLVLYQHQSCLGLLALWGFEGGRCICHGPALYLLRQAPGHERNIQVRVKGTDKPLLLQAHHLSAMAALHTCPSPLGRISPGGTCGSATCRLPSCPGQHAVSSVYLAVLSA